MRQKQQLSNGQHGLNQCNKVAGTIPHPGSNPKKGCWGPGAKFGSPLEAPLPNAVAAFPRTDGESRTTTKFQLTPQGAAVFSGGLLGQPRPVMSECTAAMVLMNLSHSPAAYVDPKSPLNNHQAGKPREASNGNLPLGHLLGPPEKTENSRIFGFTEFRKEGQLRGDQEEMGQGYGAMASFNGNNRQKVQLIPVKIPLLPPQRHLKRQPRYQQNGGEGHEGHLRCLPGGACLVGHDYPANAVNGKNCHSLERPPPPSPYLSVDGKK